MNSMTALVLGNESDTLLQLDPLNAPGVDSAYPASGLTNLDLEALFDLGDDDEPILPLDLSELETSELRTLCNRRFQEMDKDFPRFGAREDYELLREELDVRSADLTK